MHDAGPILIRDVGTRVWPTTATQRRGGLRRGRPRRHHRRGCAIVEGRSPRGRAPCRHPLRSLLLTRTRASPWPRCSSATPRTCRCSSRTETCSPRSSVSTSTEGVPPPAERRPPPPADEVLGSCSRVVVTEGLQRPREPGRLFRNAAAPHRRGAARRPHRRPAVPTMHPCVVGLGRGAAHARLGALPGGYDRLRSHGFRVVALTPSPDAPRTGPLAGCGSTTGWPWSSGRGSRFAPASIAGADAAVRIPMAPGGRLAQRGDIAGGGRRVRGRAPAVALTSSAQPTRRRSSTGSHLERRLRRLPGAQVVVAGDVAVDTERTSA